MLTVKSCIVAVEQQFVKATGYHENSDSHYVACRWWCTATKRRKKEVIIDDVSSMCRFELKGTLFGSMTHNFHIKLHAGGHGQVVLDCNKNLCMLHSPAVVTFTKVCFT